MEAVPRLHMLWFALKTSPEGTSFANLKKYIAESYQENPDSYTKEVYALETLRNVAMRPEKDMEGCSVLKRYYCQLHSLSNRFPQISERNLFTFIWKDLYINNVSEITDIKFEMAAVLFNIGALHSQVGASVSRSDVDGMKLACTHFQCAAWTFGELKNKFQGINGNGDFMTSELLMFMQQVSFAQAQECILEKSLIDNRKPTIVAKVTAQIINYYGTALVALLADGEDGTISQVVESSVFKLWQKYLKFKIFYLNCILYLYQGQQSEEQQKMGERVVLYQAAWDKLQEAQKESKGLPDQKEIMESITFTADVVEGKRKNAKNENEFIYHEALPELSDITAVQGANLVSGISFSVTDPEIAGVDLFARLIPMKAHEASSLYSEEKAQILRIYGTKIEDKDNELNLYMSSLNIDHLNVSEEKANKIPQGIVDRCASINAKTNAIPDLIQSMSNLAEICADVETNLKEIKEILSEEDIKEKQYQQTSGVHRSNAHFTEMSRECQKYLEAHQKAGDSNDTLRRAMELHVNNLRILSRPLKEIQSSVPKLSGEVNEEVFKDLKLLLNKVNEMKAQRAQFHADLRINVNDDDITGKVIANGENDLKDLFKKELGKHDKITKLIDQNLLAQANILSALTESYAKCAASLKTMADVTHKKENFYSSLAASYDVYEDLLAKSAKGLEFYKKLQGNIQKLLTRVRAARDVQDEDRQQRLKLVNRPQEQQTKANNVNSNSIVHSSSISTGPKLKDYLKGGSKSGSSSKYIPTIRPNPLGSENPTTALCTASPQAPSYIQHQQVGPSVGILDPPPPYTANLPPTHSQYSDANGYLNPIYQNTSGIYEQQPANSFNGPPPSYSQQQPQYSYTAAGQQIIGNENQLPPQYCQNDPAGYVQTLPQSKTSSGYNPQNYGGQIAITSPNAKPSTTQSYNNSSGYYAPISTDPSNNTSINYQNYNQQQFQEQISNTFSQPQQISAAQSFVQQPDINTSGYQQQLSNSLYNNQHQILNNQYQLPKSSNAVPNTALIANQLENLNLQSNQQMQFHQPISGYYSAGFQQTQNLPEQQFPTVNYQNQPSNSTESQQIPQQATNLTMQQIQPQSKNSTMQQIQQQTNNSTMQQIQQQTNNPTIQQIQHQTNNPTTQQLSTYASPSGYVFNQIGGEYQYANSYQINPGPTNQYVQMSASSNPNNITTDTELAAVNGQNYANQYSAVDQSTDQSIANAYYQNQFGFQLPQSPITQPDQQNPITNFQPSILQTQNAVSEATGSNQNVSTISYSQSNIPYGQQQPSVQQYQQQTVQQYQQPIQQQQPTEQVQQNVVKKSVSVKPKISSSNIDLLSDIDFTGSPTNISTPPLQPQIAPRKSSLSECSQISLGSQPPLNPTSLVANNSVLLIDNKTTNLEHIKNSSNLVEQQQPITQPQTPKNQSDIIPDILNDRKSSCDNLSICSDLSSLDHSFDWDSISVRDNFSNNEEKFNLKNNFNLKSNRDPFDDDKILKYFHKEVERYEKMIETMNIKMLNGNTPLANKWKDLQDLLVKDESKRITVIGKLFPEKNRSADCLPYDHARVVLERSTDDYINAAYVKDLGPCCPNFIIAQTPLPNTVNDFWSMIWTQKARTVVCLHTPNEILDTFWPQECNKEMHFDDFSVTLVKQFDLSNCIELNLKLTMNGADAILDLSLLQLKAWSKTSPSQILGIAQNVLVVHKQRCQEFKTVSPLIMNCLTGSERSGLIALSICSILATQSKRPTLSNVVDIWYRICSQRKSALRDTNNLELSMKIVLCHAHDVLNKRGIMTSYQMKNAQTVTSAVKEEIKDPLNDLDPLWKLKK